jgi:hypothetical protein
MELPTSIILRACTTLHGANKEYYVLTVGSTAPRRPLYAVGDKEGSHIYLLYACFLIFLLNQKLDT